MPMPRYVAHTVDGPSGRSWFPLEISGSPPNHCGFGSHQRVYDGSESSRKPGTPESLTRLPLCENNILLAIDPECSTLLGKPVGKNEGEFTVVYRGSIRGKDVKVDVSSGDLRHARYDRVPRQLYLDVTIKIDPKDPDSED